VRLEGLDTQILVWALQNNAARPKSDPELIRRAKTLLKYMDLEGIRPFVPAVVVGELLFPVPSETHPKALERFNRAFVIGPYDTAAASEFARVWQLRKKDKTLDVLKNDATREELKADLMILATLLSRKVPVLYTHDRPLATLAKGLILVRELPPAEAEQLKLV
jgi:predicted nucleic acid-binding protein